jgi:hypothetical protein
LLVGVEEGLIVLPFLARIVGQLEAMENVLVR